MVTPSTDSARISLERIHLAKSIIDPVFLNSPQFECESLSARLGTHLVLKVETINPIRSFKGRGASFLVSRLSEPQTLICASAGNFGQAMAYTCRQKGIHLVVYAAVNANPMKVERMRSLGAEVRLFGNDFDTAKEQARQVAKQEGLVMIEDGLAVETIEGAGTIASELLAIGTLDAVLIPLGNGALFNGMATVLKALSPGAKRIAVQTAGAPAMADSWKAGRLISYASVNTIADGIGVRLPIAEALSDMQSLADDVVTVTEASILAAMKLIHSNVGIVPEPSAAVGVAAILEDCNRFAGLRTATVLCGGNLTDEQMKTWLG